jgi:hypothetical protein
LTRRLPSNEQKAKTVSRPSALPHLFIGAAHCHFTINSANQIKTSFLDAVFVKAIKPFLIVVLPDELTFAAMSRVRMDDAPLMDGIRNAPPSNP